jgi:hypothetical protein
LFSGFFSGFAWADICGVSFAIRQFICLFYTLEGVDDFFGAIFVRGIRLCRLFLTVKNAKMIMELFLAFWIRLDGGARLFLLLVVVCSMQVLRSRGTIGWRAVGRSTSSLLYVQSLFVPFCL